MIQCVTRDDYVAALKAAKAADRTTVVVIKNDRLHGVPGYESWWDVAVPEVFCYRQEDIFFIIILVQ